MRKRYISLALCLGTLLSLLVLPSRAAGSLTAADAVALFEEFSVPSQKKKLNYRCKSYVDFDQNGIPEMLVVYQKKLYGSWTTTDSYLFAYYIAQEGGSWAVKPCTGYPQCLSGEKEQTDLGTWSGVGSSGLGTYGSLTRFANGQYGLSVECTIWDSKYQGNVDAASGSIRFSARYNGNGAFVLNQEFGTAVFCPITDTGSDPGLYAYFEKPAAPVPTAHQSSMDIQLDGSARTLSAYALWDQNGAPTNYVRIRDVAQLLQGTAAQFQVSWDGLVSVTTGQLYVPDGSEFSVPFSGDRAYTELQEQTYVNGQAVAIQGIVLTDDSGGGYTYYQLRDLGRVLGFNVGWSAEKGIFVETSAPYDPNN